ncbi:unnamed protein product [Urochloa humidicola]
MWLAVTLLLLFAVTAVLLLCSPSVGCYMMVRLWCEVCYAGGPCSSEGWIEGLDRGTQRDHAGSWAVLMVHGRARVHEMEIEIASTKSSGKTMASQVGGPERNANNLKASRLGGGRTGVNIKEAVWWP